MREREREGRREGGERAEGEREEKGEIRKEGREGCTIMRETGSHYRIYLMRLASTNSSLLQIIEMRTKRRDIIRSDLLTFVLLGYCVTES